MRKFILLLVCLCVPAVCFAAAELQLNPEKYELGAIEEGKVTRHKIEAQNTGEQELIIGAPYVSCGCLSIVSPLEKLKLKPQEKSSIEFSFNSTGYKGDVINHIYFSTNDPKRPTVNYEVHAEVVAQKQAFIDRFKTFGPLTVLSAGLLDSINPCAFTVIVFFVSFLSFAGYKKKAMWLVGVSFIAAVFISYILIGLGLFQFLKNIAIFQSVSRLIYLITGFLALGLGVFSLYDCLVYYKTKDTQKITLQLPAIIKNKIHAVIRKKTDIRPGRGEGDAENRRVFAFVLSAFSCGFIVSVLEFACTGQLYLPTIVYILGVPELRLKAIFYLLIYNLIFILPLVIILYLGVRGFTAGEFSRTMRKHLGLVKFVTALIFFSLGSALLFFIKK